MNDEAAYKKALCDEVLRKIGRNLLLFQQIECLLKFLVANQREDGSPTEIVERRQQRAGKVQRQMMGPLTEQYVDGILSDAGKPPDELDGSTSGYVSFRFTIAGDRDFHESQCVNLKLMVDERNDLVHHFLPRWRPDSLEDLTAASSYLDQQREKVMPVFEHLNGVTKSMQNARQVMAEFLASIEGRRQLELLWLQHSPLVALLREVAIQKARPDGWAYLAHAGQLAHVHESDAITHMKERYGHSTLKRLLIASELFDMQDEALPNGGFRTLYRAKCSSRDLI